jgi:hypothetical protein
VAEPADAADLNSAAARAACGFEPHLRHQRAARLDFEPGNGVGFGPLTVAGAYAQSSDTFFWQAAALAGIDRLACSRTSAASGTGPVGRRRALR